MVLQSISIGIRTSNIVSMDVDIPIRHKSNPRVLLYCSVSVSTYQMKVNYTYLYSMPLTFTSHITFALIKQYIRSIIFPGTIVGVLFVIL